MIGITAARWSGPGGRVVATALRRARRATFVQAYAGRIDNLTVEGNLLEGNGYQLGLEASRYGYGTVTAVNNRFSGTGFGPRYVSGGVGWATWADNYLYAPGAIDARGTVVTKP